MKPFPPRRRLLLLLVLAVCLFLVYSAAGERGFIRLREMVEQRDGLRSRVLDLQENNVRLAEHISLLRDDQTTIEYLARTELGMVREGETVFILKERPEKNSK